MTDQLDKSIWDSGNLSFNDICDYVEAKTGMPRDVVRRVGRRFFWCLALAFLYRSKVYIRNVMSFDYVQSKRYVRRHKDGFAYYPGGLIVKLRLLYGYFGSKRTRNGDYSNKRFHNKDAPSLREMANEYEKSYKQSGNIL